MLKALMKKQIQSIFQSFTTPIKKKKGGKSKGISKGGIVLILVVYAMLLFSMFSITSAVCGEFIALKLDWLYFSIMITVATVLGIVGSIFSTYNTLYYAKDNDLLLSMPIPPWAILFSRITSVYLLALSFEAVILLPTIISYQICTFNVVSLICSILILFVAPLFAVGFSCILGFLIACIAPYIKNKNIFITIFSIVFMVAYFMVFSRMNDFSALIVDNGKALSNVITSYLYPIFWAGSGSAGNIVSALIIIAVICAFFGVIYFVLSKTFIKLVTNRRGNAKIKYNEKKSKSKSHFSALLGKEFKRFSNSPTYMLNCGIGTLFMLIVAIALIFNKDALFNTIFEFSSGDIKDVANSIVACFGCGFICMMSSFNTITAPSISLEGKTIQLLKSLPVKSMDIFNAKILLHTIITSFSAVISMTIVNVLFFSNLFIAVITPIICVVLIFVQAQIGLLLNLKWPRLDWDNENVAVKQSMSVILSMIFSAVFAVLAFVPCFFVYNFIGLELYFTIELVVLMAVAFGFSKLISGYGTKRFKEI